MATNECAKYMIYLCHCAANLDMTDIALPTVVYNDTRAHCDWAKKTTTK